MVSFNSMLGMLLTKSVSQNVIKYKKVGCSDLGMMYLFGFMCTIFSLRKTTGKVSPILITLTSRNDSDFESSNVSLRENKT